MDDRQRIINVLKEGLQDDENVYALWLEGADGLGRTDSFSDLDFWLDVEDGREEQVLDKCQQLLSSLGNLDFIETIEHPHRQFYQRNLHVEGMSEYLIADICVQTHSRGSTWSTFYTDDIAEFPLVLFDKAGVVIILPPEKMSVETLKPIFEQCVSRFNQRPRLTKYIKRERFLEANRYFENYVRRPIIDMLRLIYTPRHYEYGYSHLSRHLPKKVVKELEELYVITCVEDIEALLEKADEIYYDAYNTLKDMLSE
ncbi:MAG: aminoglycoside 6-adenylyltransferase [Oscillospiraceae bacterium]|nr:aminoglycoside 6-adenylyltransferase [Oscillospiraceae bacterium]